jgi:hypothetical protein
MDTAKPYIYTPQSYLVQWSRYYAKFHMLVVIAFDIAYPSLYLSVQLQVDQQPPTQQAVLSPTHHQQG